MTSKDMSIYNDKHEAIAIARKLTAVLGIKHAPVDVKAIAEKLNIDVKKEFFEADDVSGLLKRKSKSGRAVIVVNASHHINRRRFSIAHEIGHYLLHSLDPVHIDRSRVYFRNAKSSLAIDSKEIQANQFAAELLMPRDLVIKDLRSVHLSPDLSDIEEVGANLAKKYKVSAQAMIFRIGAIINMGV